MQKMRGKEKSDEESDRWAGRGSKEEEQGGQVTGFRYFSGVEMSSL